VPCQLPNFLAVTVPLWYDSQQGFHDLQQGFRHNWCPSQRWPPATNVELSAVRRGRSSGAEQGPFKPRVVGSNPTGLTTPKFLRSQPLRLLESDPT
jgi:hypothetical protein